MPKLSLSTEKAKQKFLEALRKNHTIYLAAKAANVHRTTIYEWKKHDEAFKTAYDHTLDEIVEQLEKEADRRATNGVQKPVYQGGNLVGYITEYSDTLLIFRLKALAPEKYRERQEITGKGGGPVELIVRWDGNRNETSHTLTATASAAGGIIG